MLCKRIIPCLDVKDGRVVKGVRFLKLKDAGDPVEWAKAYEAQKADELVFLDITASYEGRKTMARVVREVAKNIFMPFTVGGGIAGIEDVRVLLKAGADKVSINTAAVKDPHLISEAARRFGNQCIVVAIDAKRTEDGRRKTEDGKNNRNLSSALCHVTPESKWEVYIHGGRTATGLDVVAWAKKAQRLGAGEILLTSMDLDGTKDGYDIALTAAVSKSLKIPVIASGGAGLKAHFLDVFKKGHADAALAASIFHYGEFTVAGIKKYLKSNGVNVRTS
ncbi:MAG: imidazole glycerol phosphate synthase subunit HisF [Candidatus Omnitrophica bacterium CG1_02_44_16]|nr:MAG: imidazole glycerol phosphate synthase subunit HisF [Candidatus Omnitrophica bacterium CG1_02_44_16]PIY83406.1 MAG: imidazole glycerol phosphate synthase subunit HisF [Candidatus Omnitrophica bacterium CG_4_10_14_0_8_um_filter_44_12]PIZ83497.1 MAG: imidazole glycerol phosphate synthase subunit HisF [Candidatus Omnitrophica bacterium CG_4_10_14_0_2_um_filter_44_9]